MEGARFVGSNLFLKYVRWLREFRNFRFYRTRLDDASLTLPVIKSSLRLRNRCIPTTNIRTNDILHYYHCFAITVTESRLSTIGKDPQDYSKTCKLNCLCILGWIRITVFKEGFLTAGFHLVTFILCYKSRNELIKHPLTFIKGKALGYLPKSKGSFDIFCWNLLKRMNSIPSIPFLYIDL